MIYFFHVHQKGVIIRKGSNFKHCIICLHFLISALHRALSDSQRHHSASRAQSPSSQTKWTFLIIIIIMAASLRTKQKCARHVAMPCWWLLLLLLQQTHIKRDPSGKASSCEWQEKDLILQSHLSPDDVCFYIDITHTQIQYAWCSSEDRQNVVVCVILCVASALELVLRMSAPGLEYVPTIYKRILLFACDLCVMYIYLGSVREWRDDPLLFSKA